MMLTLNEIFAKLDDGTRTPKEIMDIIDDNEVYLMNYKTLCKSDMVHKAIKIFTLTNCNRIDTYEFEQMYGVELPLGKIISISKNNNISYYLYVSSKCEVKSIKVKERREGGTEIIISDTTRTCSNKSVYNCHAVNGTNHLFGTKKNIQIYRHILIAIAYGLYDDINIEDIYSLVINHKDGDIFNNSIDNLELCTSSENNIHGKVIATLKENGVYISLSAKDAVKVAKLTKEQISRFIDKYVEESLGYTE